MKRQKAKFKIQGYVFLIIFLGSLLLPLVSLAGTYRVCNIDPGNGRCLAGTEKDATYQGLVPCGKEISISGLGDRSVPCQFCHFFVMFDGIVKFVLFLVIIIAVLMFVIGGFMFLLAAGNPGTVQNARKILTSTATGLVIIFASWIIVNTIFIFIGVANWTNLRQGWFIIDCPIQLSAAPGGGGVGATGLDEFTDINSFSDISLGTTIQSQGLAANQTLKVKVPQQFYSTLYREGMVLYANSPLSGGMIDGPYDTNFLPSNIAGTPSNRIRGTFSYGPPGERQPIELTYFFYVEPAYKRVEVDIADMTIGSRPATDAEKGTIKNIANQAMVTAWANYENWVEPTAVSNDGAYLYLTGKIKKITP